MKKSIIPVIALIAIAMLSSCSKKQASKTITVTSADDLATLTLGCQESTTGELFVQDNLPNAKIRSFRTGMDAALDLKNGGIDAIILDELPSKAIVAANPDLKIIDIDLATEEYAIAVKKGNAELLKSINTTIATMKANGEYENLINTFMPADGNIVLPVHIATSGDVVKVGLNAGFPPFEYTDGTDVVGFDITMSEMIARDAGRKLEVVDMAFGGLIAALQSDQIDFIASGMTATDERRQNVDFSEPYFTSKQVIIVRK